MASDALAKFSDLLRYQLYECNDIQIPLSKELSYMENFIELEKLRQNDNVEVNVQSEEFRTENLGIAPFVLMIFVENAFKHVSKDAGKDNWIKINVALNDRTLGFCISNSVSSSVSNDLVHYGGIGLKNVQRRLDLIYPQLYKLDIKSSESSFDVKLILNLSELFTPEFAETTI